MNNIITSVAINGFKGFGDPTKISFEKLTVLAGANSVGKSSIIQALLLSRMTIGEGKKNISAKKIPLNKNYLLALGDTRQITTKKQINFDFTLQSEESFNLNYDVPIESNYISYNNLKSLVDKFNNCLASPDFHYLNAERIGPRPLHENTVFTLPNVGCQGEFAIQLLVDGLTFQTSPFKNFDKIIHTDKSSRDDLSTQSDLWMQFIIPDISITANRINEINRSTAKYNQHTPPNVGFGISYILPIIVSGLIAKEGSMFIVENPEAHLHPFGQSRIGQFLAMVAASGVQVIVETHSEHVINGMRLAAAKGFISHNDVLINFLSKDEETNKINVTAIEVDDSGDLTDFPPGFFDQSAQDLVQLTRIRRQKI